MWPAFNPEISSYGIQGTLDNPVTIRLNSSSNAVVTVNGKVISGDSFTSRGGIVEIKVTSGDGKQSKTYTLDLGQELPPEVTENAPVNNTIVIIAVLVAVVALAAVATLLVLRKKNNK